MIQELLTEKLRPKKFEHLILPTRVKNALGNGKIIQNILMYGSQGTGKTSASKVLASGLPSLYINASDENSIDVIRTKINDFCSSISVMDFDETLDDLKKENGRPIKVVLLDEVDGASESFFKALRGTIEKFAKGSRFIMTANFINKIPEPIQSRFECINFDFVNKEEEREVLEQWNNALPIIFEKLGISIKKDALKEFISRKFPDMRSALNSIQSFQIQGIKDLTIDKVKEVNWNFEDVYNLLVGQTDPHKNYEFIVGNYGSMVDDVMASLGSDFIKWIKEKHQAKAKAVPQVIITVAHHQAQRNLVIDPVVSLLSLCFSIQKILNS